jgi:hypothetical protein
MLKTFIACLHNKLDIWMSLFINLDYQNKLQFKVCVHFPSKKVCVHTYRFIQYARTSYGHICSVEYNCFSHEKIVYGQSRMSKLTPLFVTIGRLIKKLCLNFVSNFVNILLVHDSTVVFNIGELGL